ncbi:MarR family winged helix-turn-helix transcriptional regulator [Dickeya chrysanthemi]|uniref:MarR family winged helix-turn-helix transcriptional regulator n=1 Tax=Dickeya TaxID=204037 RepID=UPI000532AE51|nr:MULTISPECIES: MarR family winged helix-turn-helix transcriptional regulator [Dickeya]TYL42739.1 winged helix-turn-helix transcriptional regulator [Dickeya sp. ws52]WJM84302.1 MarR family winged helix-turn-helix transcriptional regulator [Dickeya chrysanthemi]
MHRLDELGRQLNHLDNLLQQWMKKLDFNYKAFAVLHSLVTSPDGQCTQKQICERWGLPKQTVFSICKLFKEQGLIDINESQHDKRERILTLTEQGKKHSQPILTQSQILSERTFRIFGQERTQQLFSNLEEFCLVFEQEMGNVPKLSE